MARDKVQPTIKALTRLLSRERELILAGEVAKVGRLVPEKERLLRTLNATDDDLPALGHIRQMADHNQHLLMAAARGIRSVVQRLDALRSSQTELRTYTQAGQPRDLSERQSQFERKA